MKMRAWRWVGAWVGFDAGKRCRFRVPAGARVVAAGAFAAMSGVHATEVTFTVSAPCSNAAPCVTSLDGLKVPGLPGSFDLSFVHGSSLFQALPDGPQFNAADAYLAAVAMTEELDARSPASPGRIYGFLAGDGTRSVDALIPYLSDGAYSYLAASYLGSSDPPQWTLGTDANYGPGLDAVYVRFEPKVPEPSATMLLAVALMPLAWGRFNASHVRGPTSRSLR